METVPPRRLSVSFTTTTPIFIIGTRLYVCGGWCCINAAYLYSLILSLGWYWQNGPESGFAYLVVVAQPRVGSFFWRREWEKSNTAGEWNETREMYSLCYISLCLSVMLLPRFFPCRFPMTKSGEWAPERREWEIAREKICYCQMLSRFLSPHHPVL